MRARLVSFRPRLFPVPYPQSRVVLLAAACAGLAVLAALVLLAQTGYVTTSGYHIQSLERLRTAQDRNIQQLEADVAALTSLARAGQEAKARWNMAAPEKLLHIMVDVPHRSPASSVALPSQHAR